VCVCVCVDVGSNGGKAIKGHLSKFNNLHSGKTLSRETESERVRERERERL